MPKAFLAGHRSGHIAAVGTDTCLCGGEYCANVRRQRTHYWPHHYRYRYQSSRAGSNCRFRIEGHPEIAIGNVVGSNILNILAVLAVPALLGGVELNHVALWRDAGMMTALTMMLALFAYGINSRAVITRFEGAVMLAAWIGYNLLLIHQAWHEHSRSIDVTAARIQGVILMSMAF